MLLFSMSVILAKSRAGGTKSKDLLTFPIRLRSEGKSRFKRTFDPLTAKRPKAAFHGKIKSCRGYASLMSARSFDSGSVSFCEKR